nr:hypothetical protein [Clostridiales bacterium]
MKSKENKKNDFYRKSLVTIIIITVFYIIYLLFSKSFNRILTQPALLETVTQSISSDMFIIRDEIVIKNNIGTTVASLVSDGEKVSSGTPVAGSFDSQQSAENYLKVKYLTEKLLIYEKINSQLKLASADIESLSKNTDTDVLGIIDSVYDNDFTSLSQNILSFDENNSRMNISLGMNVDCTQKINQIKTEINSYSGAKILKYAYADRSGYFVKNLDGYENLINIEDLDSLTEDQIENALSSDRKNYEGNDLGKIICGFNWYAACLINTDDLADFQKDSSVTLILGETDESKVKAKVYSRVKTDSGKILLLFKCNTMNSTLASLRKVNGRIVVNTFKGLKIPKQAIRFV